MQATHRYQICQYERWASKVASPVFYGNLFQLQQHLHQLELDVEICESIWCARCDQTTDVPRGSRPLRLVGDLDRQSGIAVHLALLLMPPTHRLLTYFSRYTVKTLLNRDTEISEEALRAIAYMPTKNLPAIMDDGFLRKLTDADFMHVAVLLAQKSYNEGGCPIGAVIINNSTRAILGKGHNTLVQESHPYNHGETSAMRDAGRLDFSQTTLFTSLSPCDVCTALISMRGFGRVVVGDVSNAAGNELILRERGVDVDILEDQCGIELYAKFRAEKPDQDLEDWQGLSALGS